MLSSQDCLKLIKVLEISEIFLMTDLKAHLENLAVQILDRTNVKVLCEKADMFACSKLLEACVQLMVKEGISFDKEEVLMMPDATVAFLRAFKTEMDKRKDSGVELGANYKRVDNRGHRQLRFSDTISYW